RHEKKASRLKKPYAVKCADLRIRKCKVLNAWLLIPGYTTSMILRRKPPVCSAENASVEKLSSTTIQISGGSQMRNLRPGGTVMRLGITDVDKELCLLDSIVGSFTRDDHVMHVALTQACAADANELRLLLQFRDRLGSAVTHPRSQSADELIHHLCQCSAIRHAPLDPFRNQLAHAVALGATETEAVFPRVGG